MVGKFCASASYAIIYLYSSELFPTSVRNSGMGTCSMMAKVGAIVVAPLFLSMGDSLNSTSFPFFVFGISGILGAATAVLLPETLNKNLPETVVEAERVNKFG